MTEESFSHRLAALLARKGLSKQRAAEMSGVKYHALNAILQRENAVPNAIMAQQIADGLGVPIEHLTKGALIPESATVAVVGRVGAGATVPLVDAYAKGDGLYLVRCPPQVPPTGIAAVEVEGDSMSPMYQPGHVLFFSRSVHDGILDIDLGKPCVAEDEDGNAWVKLVKRGTEPGKFHLISLNPSSDSAWDKRIKWATRVRLALPYDMVERV